MDTYKTKLLDLRCMDCMDLMRETPDKHYALAIVDPEYGIKLNGPCGRFEKYGTLQSVNSKPPDQAYFDELFRVAVKVIVWGGNYFNLGPTQAFRLWDKMQPEGVTFADSEFAWTNLDGVARTFRMRPQNADTGGRIHPTQKPVALYRWLLAHDAHEDDNILDTHMGSGSIAIACHYAGYHLTATELDPDYFGAAVERIKRETAQLTLGI